ncbi:MAG: hypothetical protein HC811_06985 [Flammeovirgaceae bacterium]|nr:hypothetical protein [Flammeovirgaceae bacterium]
MGKKVLFLLLLITSFEFAVCQDSKTVWVDSVLREMNLQEKIGQLFMIPFTGEFDEEKISSFVSRVKESKAGGIYIKGGGPQFTAQLINRIQKVSKVPVLAAIDAEWGLGQSLDSAMIFSSPILLGALRMIR